MHAGFVQLLAARSFARGRRRKPERDRLGKVANDRKGAPVLKDWETFFFMLGSAGAGLIGLLFVVVTLTAQSAGNQEQRTFSLTSSVRPRNL